MDESDSSSLSSAPEDEVQKLAPIFAKAKKATKLKAPPPKVSPPRPKRDPSPPHEDAFADNADIAFLVMFRSRFAEQLPAKLAHLGPQDIEHGVIDNPPSQQVEAFLCSVLALVLNRTKPVEKGHYGRAMEEAFLKHKAQWPRRWEGVNPLRGSIDFNSLGPLDRIDILRTLVHWSLSSSDILRAKLQEAYKQVRHSDDENQGLSVQPWGQDGDKRRYYLIEGQDDTAFRVYREGTRHGTKQKPQWYSMAGDIPELRTLATKLEGVDGTQAARRLAGRMLAAIPRFEQSEDKRKKREQRQARRAAFSRPEPGFSMYEGRTRGKRMRYTYDDDDEDETLDSDATSARRSTRQQSNRSTPFEAGPTFTASGRQVRSRAGGTYGESKLSNQVHNTDELAPEYEDGVNDDGSDGSDPVRGGRRTTRNAGKGAPESGSRKRKLGDGRNNIDEMSDEDDATPSGDEWNGAGDDDNDEDKAMADVGDENEASETSSSEEDEVPDSLVVKLKVDGARNRKGAVVDIKAKIESGDTEFKEHEARPCNSILQDSTIGAHETNGTVGLQRKSDGGSVANEAPLEPATAPVLSEAGRNSKTYWEEEKANGLSTGAYAASTGVVGYQ